MHLYHPRLLERLLEHVDDDSAKNLRDGKFCCNLANPAPPDFQTSCFVSLIFQGFIRREREFARRLLVTQHRGSAFGDLINYYDKRTRLLRAVLPVWKRSKLDVQHADCCFQSLFIASFDVQQHLQAPERLAQFGPPCCKVVLLSLNCTRSR